MLAVEPFTRVHPRSDADPCSRCEARRLSVCSSLAEEGSKRLGALADLVTFRPDDVLVREGDPAGDLYNITSGAVRVFRLLADGRRQIVGFLFPGDFLGGLTGQDYMASAEALGPVTACRFDREDYRRLMRDQPRLETALLDRTCNELLAAQDQMLLLGRKTALERLASFLTDLSRRAKRRGDPEALLDLPMTRGEIADYLGLTTETVSRGMSKLKARGLVSLPSLHSVELRRPHALAELAGLA